MTTTDIETQTPAPPIGAQRVACRHCTASAGSACITPNGVTRPPHIVRYDEYRSAMRSEQFVVVIREDDDRFPVAAGEEYLAETYRYDPGSKVTLLHRLSDGFVPECNQYWGNVQWLRWAS